MALTHPINWSLEYDDAAPPLPEEIELSPDQTWSIPPGAYLIWLDPVHTRGSGNREKGNILLGVFRALHRRGQRLARSNTRLTQSYEDDHSKTDLQGALHAIQSMEISQKEKTEIVKQMIGGKEKLLLSGSADLYTFKRTDFCSLLEELKACQDSARRKNSNKPAPPSPDEDRRRLKLLQRPRSDYRYYFRLVSQIAQNKSPTPPIILGFETFYWMDWTEGWRAEKPLYVTRDSAKKIWNIWDENLPKCRRRIPSELAYTVSNGFDTAVAKLGLIRLTEPSQSPLPAPDPGGCLPLGGCGCLGLFGSVPKTLVGLLPGKKKKLKSEPSSQTCKVPKLKPPTLRHAKLRFHLQLESKRLPAKRLRKYLPKARGDACTPCAKDDPYFKDPHWKEIGNGWEALKEAGWSVEFPTTSQTNSCEPKAQDDQTTERKGYFEEIPPPKVEDQGGGWTQYQLNRYHDRYIEAPARQYLDRGILGHATESMSFEYWEYNFLLVDKILLGPSDHVHGLMYDSGNPRGGDLPRQGAAVSEKTLPKDECVPAPGKPIWGQAGFWKAHAEQFKGFTFYLIHEMGHMMGLYHSLECIMMPRADEEEPDKCEWPDFPEHFSPIDRFRLAHLPDHWVRPGGVPFGFKYRSAPLSFLELVPETKGLHLEMKPIHVCLEHMPEGLELTLTNYSSFNILCPNNRHAQPSYGRLGVHIIHPSGRQEEAWPIHSPRELGGLGNSSLLRGETINYHVRWDSDWPELPQVGVYTVMVHLLWAVADRKSKDPDELPTDDVQLLSNPLNHTSSNGNDHPLRTYRASATGVLRVLLHAPE